MARTPLCCLTLPSLRNPVTVLVTGWCRSSSGSGTRSGLVWGGSHGRMPGLAKTFAGLSRSFAEIFAKRLVRAFREVTREERLIVHRVPLQRGTGRVHRTLAHAVTSDPTSVSPLCPPGTTLFPVPVKGRILLEPPARAGYPAPTGGSCIPGWVDESDHRSSRYPVQAPSVRRLPIKLTRCGYKPY